MAETTVTKTSTRLSWIAQVTAAVILGQTLFFKLAGTPESIYIFERLGVEPWGRYATGMFEVVAVVLLLIPRTAVAVTTLIAASTVAYIRRRQIPILRGVVSRA
jgi:hypothetical protein